MQNLPIIAFKGAAGSGKSTAASYLCDVGGYRRTSFALPLKEMMRALGLSEEQVNGSLKETPTDLLSGRTPREAMQTLGTEWGREFHPDLWVNLWRGAAQALLDTGELVVVDDCRFPNEAAIVRALGGYVIEVVGEDDVDAACGIVGHASETQDFDPDITVINGKRDLVEFHAAIDEALAVLASDDAHADAA